MPAHALLIRLLSTCTVVFPGHVVLLQFSRNTSSYRVQSRVAKGNFSTFHDRDHDSLPLHAVQSPLHFTTASAAFKMAAKSTAPFATFLIIGCKPLRPRPSLQPATKLTVPLPFRSNLFLPRHPLRALPVRLPCPLDDAERRSAVRARHLRVHAGPARAVFHAAREPPEIPAREPAADLTHFAPRDREANMLFDGASLVLYMCGITVYIANIVKGLRTVTAGAYGGDVGAEGGEEKTPLERLGEGDFIGREDSLKVLAASNTILALVLVGVLILQAGQWYAQRKEAEEMAEMDKARDEKRKGRAEARKNK
nr:hypothetical protein CFP56_25816 [Quercus suber]